ncbi:MAG: transglutaminase family protein, partial [Thermomicrobiales bacterium]
MTDSKRTEPGTFGFVATDASEIAWDRVARVSYLIRQQFRYDYPGPISNLQQRLIVIPPERHGDQRLVMHKIEVSSRSSEARHEIDRFGNWVINLSVDLVPDSIEFVMWVVVERLAGGDPAWIDPRITADESWRLPTPLTTPSDELRDVARQIAGEASSAEDLAVRLNSYVHRSMRYRSGSTTVETGAADAFASRQGVCQDFAHILLALCRENGLPARYVSGHLLGEGATHAWVEVLLPDLERPGRTIAVPFDPTHGTRAGFNYITVAIGRDYRDVAPTSGQFWAPYSGELTATKLAGALAIQYRD